MSFKLKSPYKINPVSVHQVPFSPDNIGENNGLVAKANDNGTIIMNKNIPQDSKLYNNAMSHEGRHLKDMMDNKLAYDENFVYENMDGKGAKKHSRSSFSEDDKTLSWEAPAYKDGDNGVDHDLRPKPNKLSGIPSMKDETPIAFKVMGSRHKEGRSPDKEKISMNERFAMYAPAKTWGGPSMDTDPLVSGGEPDAGGNTDTNYEGDQIRFDNINNKFFGTKTACSTAQVATGDLYEIKDGKFRGDLTADMQKDDNKINYNQYLSSDMRKLQKAKEQFNLRLNNQPMSSVGAKFSGKGKKGNNIQYIRTPDSPDFDPNLTTKENMMNQIFTAEYYDKDGTLTNSAAAMPLSEMNPIARGQIFSDNTAQKNKAFLESDSYGEFANKYKTIFRK